MPEFSIDDVLSQFGEKPKEPVKGTFDVDSIVSKFGSSDTATPIKEDKPRIDVYRNEQPAPPISGISKEASDELNATREKKFGLENPRSKLPTTNISESAYDADQSGKENISGGIEDFGSGHPYKGAGKVLLGGAQRAMAPLTGLIEGGIGTPVTDITGNKDIGDRAAFVAGSLIPVAPGGSAVVKAIPKNKALSTLVESIGPENLAPVVSAMKANPRLAPADLSPKVLQDTQHLFANDGPQINYLADTSTARLAGSKDAVTGAVNSSMGTTVNAAQKVEDLKNAARKIGKKNIEPVLAAKPHTDVTDLIKHIDSEVGYPAMKAIKEGKAPPLPLNDYQRELLNVRNKLRNVDWPDRDKMFAYTDQVHDAQIKLREKAQGLSTSAAGSERNTAKDLLSFREKMKDAVGPEYKEALAKYAGQKKVEEAFHNGYDTILSNSKKLENDPSFFEKWVNSKSRKPGELEAAREGARLRIQHEIDGARTAATNPSSKAIGIGQTEFSVKRLEALLGKEEAGKLLKTLDDERKIANTHNKIMEGSQTANRMASKERFTMPTPTELGKTMLPIAVMEGANVLSGGIGGVGTALYAGARVAHAVKDKVKLALAREHNSQYAKLALPTQGPSRDELIRQLEARIPGPKQSLVTRGTNALSRIVGP